MPIIFCFCRRLARTKPKNAGVKSASVWRNSNLKRYSANDFTINLPTNLLQNGGYVINIYGIENGKQPKTESYQIKINRETR
jgi:hypothetical protein